MVQEDGPMKDNNSNGTAELFEYADCPGAPFVQSWGAWDAPAESAGRPEESTASDTAHDSEGTFGAEKTLAAHFEQKLAEETRTSFETGRVRGIEEGRKAEREAQAEELAAAKERAVRQTGKLIEDFAKQRERYFRVAEQELVKLALAVAARILRREAAIDPLLLLGAVRAALGQIADLTEVRVRVPAADLALWTESVALLPNLEAKPTVVAGEGMQTGECKIETALGTADLSLRSQLGEVDRALLADLRDGKRKPPTSASVLATKHAETTA